MPTAALAFGAGLLLMGETRATEPIVGDRCKVTGIGTLAEGGVAAPVSSAGSTPTATG